MVEEKRGIKPMQYLENVESNLRILRIETC